MGDNYLNLKRKIFIQIIVKAVLLGLSLGMLVGSALALVQKLTTDKIGTILCILAGVVVFALVSGLYLLITSPTEKRIAKNLDEKLALNEKVQTMLAYKKKQGAIFELQREDTNNSLVGAKIKTISYKVIAIIVCCFLIGVGMLTTAILIPETTEPPVVIPNVPFELTDIQVAAIEEIILHVNNSEMEEPYRANIVSELTKMLEDLKLVTTIEDRDTVLDTTIEAILTENDNSSSAIEIINELWKSNANTVKKLAKVLNYYDLPKIDEWDKFITRVTELRATFNYELAEGEELVEEKRIEATKLLFATSAEQIMTALASSKIDENDALYKVVLRFATASETDEEFGTRLSGLQTISQLIEAMGYTDAQRELDSTFTQLNNEIYDAISQQRTNTETGEYAITKICALFSYPIPKFERPQLIESSTDDSTGNESSGGVSGGIGQGTEYGSDDLVYDPFTNKYVEYGVILEKYYALMFGKVESGDYTEEEKLAMEKYFDILYNGFDEDNTENENTEN